MLAIKRLESGDALEDVLVSLDNAISHYQGYKQRNKAELTLDEDNYKIADSIIYYIAAIDTLARCRESIVSVVK